MSGLRLLTVVGARPQFVKAAALHRALAADGRGITSDLVHTGQHYDPGLSDVLFEQLELPPPTVHLGIGSGGHGAQTGAMLTALEPIVEERAPDVVVVYGDTNSTLAGALVAAKLHVPVAHVEAGLRSFRRDMPEEVNRVVTDHVADLLFCPSDVAVTNLAAEGVVDGVHQVGDVMHDVLLHELARARAKLVDSAAAFDLAPGGFVLATVHRAANTDDPERLAAILDGLAAVADAGVAVVLPLHPRTRARLQGREVPAGVRLVDPLGYEECLLLAADARVVATDSGGLQKEAYWLGTPCVTLRDETEWVETVELGWNRLVPADAAAVADAVLSASPAGDRPPVYGSGDAAAQILDVLATWREGRGD